MSWVSLFVLSLGLLGPAVVPNQHARVHTTEEAGESSKCRTCGHTFNSHTHTSWNTYCLVYQCECEEFVPMPIITLLVQTAKMAA